MAQQHLTLLPFIALLLACCVTPSVQDQDTYVTYFNAINGTVISWPRIYFIYFTVPYLQIYLYNQAALNPGTSMDMTTEFFDVNTSEVLWSESSLRFIAGVSANSKKQSGNTISLAKVISPCQVLQWNATNRWISVRNIMLFSTTSVNRTMINQTIRIDGTLQDGLSTYSTSPTTYRTILIPASNKSYTRSVFQANGSFVSTSFEDLPFESFCFNQEGSCSNTNCLAKGDIAAYSTSKTFSVDSLRPSGVYFLSFNTTSFGDNVPYSLDVQVTEREIQSTSGGEGLINNRLLSALLSICTLVFIGALQC